MPPIARFNIKCDHFPYMNYLDTRVVRALNVDDLLDAPLIRLPLANPVNIRTQLWVLLWSDHSTSLRRDKREVHQDVRPGELVTTQEATAIGSRAQLTFQKVEVALVVGRQEGGLDLPSDHPGERLDEEGYRRVLDTCYDWSTRTVSGASEGGVILEATKPTIK